MWACEEPQPNVYVVRSDDAKGRWLAAVRGLEDGAFVFLDHPVVHLQHHYSRAVLRTCLTCRAVLGTLGHVIDGLLKRVGQSLDEVCPELTGAEILKIKANGELATAADSGMLPCEGGCGEAFCSEACRMEACSLGHHRLTCIEMEPDRRGFLLAALLILQAIVEVKYNDRKVDEVEEALLASRVARPWEDLRELEASGLQDWKSWSWKRCEWVSRASLMLRDAFAPAVDSQFHRFFEVQFFSRLVGMVDLNSKALGYPNPLCRLAREHASKEPAVLAAFEKRLRQKLHRLWSRAEENIQCKEISNFPAWSELGVIEEYEEENGEDEDPWSDLLPSCQGIAIFPLTSMMNHSCEPNVMVKCTGGRAAVAKALRCIEADEELSISYICESEPVSSRQRELYYGWGFRCSCRKCLEELSDPSNTAQDEDRHSDTAESGQTQRKTGENPGFVFAPQRRPAA
eukprot:TRINITY_DN52731_c0_g1_i2.p1 TRINITY_DN52731_c0_g1~~TRINITY_DN52731_c0_g1_i2.p1  ORF type:complete len:478 (+),score=89.16 TRINITY_DN52731_c0_g1_i2:61-1434(+)